MNIRAELLTEHTKELTKRIVVYIGGRDKRFSEVDALVRGDDLLLAQRASWVIGICGEEEPEMVSRYMGGLLQHLRESPNLHNGIKRNVMRAATFVPIREEFVGLLTELSFDYLADPEESIAVRVHSMTALLRVCEVERDLVDELRLVIEDQLPHTRSAGFHSRARHVLRALDRLSS